MEPLSLERPVLAVDVAVFTVFESTLYVLTHPRGNEPFKGAHALPGTAVQVDETLLSAAKRALSEKTPGILDKTPRLFLEQLAAFDGLYRDPRGRTVSIAFLGVVPKGTGQGQGQKWNPVFTLQKGDLPFDHVEIAAAGAKRLSGKLTYTNIAKAFLHEPFRIEAIEEVYKAVLQQPVNRHNFRNKLLKIGMIEQVGVIADVVGKKGGRPPHLYRFSQKLLSFMEKDFL